MNVTKSVVYAPVRQWPPRFGKKWQNETLDADLKHTSTAIEGNTLALGEVDFIMSESLTVAGKPLKDHREVVGHARAIDLVYRLLDRPVLTEQDLFDLHKAVMTETVADTMSPVGAYKCEPNSTNEIAPDGRQVVIEFPSPDRTSAHRRVASSIQCAVLRRSNRSAGGVLGDSPRVRVDPPVLRMATADSRACSPIFPYRG